MSDTAERFGSLAAGFAERVRAVPDDAWTRPAPCEGWVARDVVAHLVEWVPGMILGGPGLRLPDAPSVEEDPAGAWDAVADAVQAALDEPETAAREFDMRVGRFTVERAVAMFVLGDVLIHTWDLARATGLDERLDTAEVARALTGFEKIDHDMLVASGQFGPPVPVPDDADPQTRLIALSGRDPNWAPAV